MSSLPFVSREFGYRRNHGRRSRNGCLTCKRRKVRCNEQKPQCYHCQRLNLECKWKGNGHQGPLDSPNQAMAGDPPESTVATSASALEVDWPSPSAAFFDFTQHVTEPTDDMSLFQDVYLPEMGDTTMPAVDALHFAVPSANLDAAPGSTLTPARPSPQSLSAHPDEEDPMLLHTPPIPDLVESRPLCAPLRAMFASMAASCPMVRYSMAAFAAVRFYPPAEKANCRNYYDMAASDLSERFHTSDGVMKANSDELRYVLTTIFFLTYTNLLTGRLDLASSHLARAHKAIQTAGTSTLGSFEQRMISWIRWSDARAALAGGEGLLVNDTSTIYPSSPSSTSPTASIPESTGSETDYGPQEIIYGILCQPGIAFFQEVQTITGRITRIAHHHRSRGSVEDETEVMAIAAQILKDLPALHSRRPALMDHAVSGNIDSDTLAGPLAAAIVRSFQTYLANYYVCYVHLHRVAHRHLDRSSAVDTALHNIKEISHLMVDKSETIPVSMLWPLFLWGSEEDDQDECQWILKTIRGLRHVATNANMAADVLQETQKRQREAGSRVDIRSVCLDLFNATFAII